MDVCSSRISLKTVTPEPNGVATALGYFLYIQGASSSSTSLTVMCLYFGGFSSGDASGGGEG